MIRQPALVATAALLITAVTLMPAGEPPTPPKKEAEPVAKETRVDDGFPLPPNAVHRFGNRQLRHPEGIIASAISPDGKLLATASYSAIVVWDLKTLSAKHTLTKVNFNNYTSGDRGGQISFLPDSQSILFATRPPNTPGLRIDGPVDLAQVWDLKKGELKFALKGTWNYYVSTWLINKGKEIALDSYNGNTTVLRIFNADTGKELREVNMPSVATQPWVAPGGETVAAPGASGTGLGVFEVQTGKEIFSVAEGAFTHVAIARDGKTLVAADNAGKVHAYDLPKKKELFAFDHPEKNRPGPMLLSDDAQRLYFTSNNGRVLRWDMKDNQKGPDFGNRHNFWSMTSIALNPDETILYSMSQDHLIKRWDLKTGKEMELPVGYTTHTTSALTADGKHLIVSDHEGQVDFWDLATGKLAKQLQPSHLGGINCMTISSDGRWLVGGRTGQDMRLFDLSTGKVVRDIPLGDNSDSKWSDQVQRVAFNADAKALYSSSGKTGVTAWESPAGKKLWNTPQTGQFMAVDPNGRWIATGGGYDSDQIRWALLDARNGEVIARIDVERTEVLQNQIRYQYPPYVSDLIFTPDGTRLLTAHYDGTVREWDPETRRLLRTLKTHTLGGTAVLAFSPDGRWLAVGGWDRTVTLWELATGKQIYSLAGHHSDVTQVSFTRDGRGLVSHADLSPVLWSITPVKLPAVDGPATELWNGLASEDSAKAYRLQWALARKPDIAVAMFRERLKPGDLTIEREKFDKWVTGLDHAQFRVREVSEKELSSAGVRVPDSWIRKAIRESKSDEQRARLERLKLAREKQTDPEAWRVRRAIQVLELAGTPEAKELLTAWSKAATESPLAEEAKAAIGRFR